jgi:hypothetical protein
MGFPFKAFPFRAAFPSCFQVRHCPLGRWHLFGAQLPRSIAETCSRFPIKRPPSGLLSTRKSVSPTSGLNSWSARGSLGFPSHPGIVLLSRQANLHPSDPSMRFSCRSKPVRVAPRYCSRPKNGASFELPIPSLGFSTFRSASGIR